MGFILAERNNVPLRRRDVPDRVRTPPSYEIAPLGHNFNFPSKDVEMMDFMRVAARGNLSILIGKFNRR